MNLFVVYEMVRIGKGFDPIIKINTNDVLHVTEAPQTLNDIRDIESRLLEQHKTYDDVILLSYKVM